MGPELMIASAVASAAAGGVKAFGEAKALKSQAASDQQRAEIEAAWAERRGLEERAGAQSQAFEEARKAKLAQSRLMAVAGASGSRIDDATVKDLYGDIETEGQVNAGRAQAAGDQRAAGLKYQADLGRWTADANARLKRQAAKSTLIGGAMGMLGTAASGVFNSRMAARYGQADLGLQGGGTGYSSGSNGIGPWQTSVSGG